MVVDTLLTLTPTFIPGFRVSRWCSGSSLRWLRGRSIVGAGHRAGLGFVIVFAGAQASAGDARRGGQGLVREQLGAGAEMPGTLGTNRAASAEVKYS